ncbi:MAG: hypothetical protein AB7K52_03195 [Phycisphaerales bacterium]
MGHSAGAGGGTGGRRVKMLVAGLFAVCALGAAAWQWQAYSRPRPNAREARLARAGEPGGPGPAGAAGHGEAPVAPGDAPTGVAGTTRRVVDGPSGASPPGGIERSAGSLEEAARQMGTTPEALREQLEWMRPDASVMGEVPFEFPASRSDAEAASVRELLKVNIEKAAPAVLRWSTAPSSEAEQLAVASTEAILGRVRGEEAYRSMVAQLGGDASSLPVMAGANGAPARGAELRAAMSGASIEPTKVRLRARPVPEDGGLALPKDAPPGAMMVTKSQTGDGPEITQIIAPTGGLFPAAASAADGEATRVVEVRVPLKFATVRVDPGMASLIVTMVRIKDGTWQPLQFAIFISDEAAAKALLPRRGQ